jgi:putative flavoprotein involved in K+ transport
VEVIDTVVMGAGSAGLAAAWELRKANTTFAVLDAGDQPGESWSQRYDCLRLFTPARFCALPGWDLPIPPTAHPDKHQMADYLARYSERFAFPVRAKTEAQSHQFVNGRHQLITGNGDEIHARRLGLNP